MKRFIVILIALVLVLLLVWFAPHSLFSVEVQNPALTVGPDTTQITTNPTATAVNIASVTPTTEASTQPDGSLVSFENISFVIPTGLASGTVSASGADGQSMPPGDAPLNVAPDYIKFTLKDYPVRSDYETYQPEVRVYPAAEYASLSGWAAESLKRLQNVLTNPATGLDNASLPNVPFLGSSAQLYAAQAKLVSFKNGKGVRMISSYAQYPAPIGPHTNIYHFEGLTDDGKYYVVVWMPINLPLYSDASNPGENGITYPTNYQSWDDVTPYYNAMTILLNDSSPESFNPILSQLDLLAQSISISAK